MLARCDPPPVQFDDRTADRDAKHDAITLGAPLRWERHDAGSAITLRAPLRWERHYAGSAITLGAPLRWERHYAGSNEWLDRTFHHIYGKPPRSAPPISIPVRLTQNTHATRLDWQLDDARSE